MIFSRQKMLIFTSLLTLLIIVFSIWLMNLHSNIETRVKSGWFPPPVEFYSSGPHFFKEQKIEISELILNLKLYNLKEETSARLRPGHYTWWPRQLCQQSVSTALNEYITQCLAIRSPKSDETPLQVLAFDEVSTLQQLFEGEPLVEVEELEWPSSLYAQYYGGHPILRDTVKLTDVPLFCSQAVTAIEDQDFLNHSGFSPTSFLRAAIKNLLSGYYAQGGSTITQQLVKNYFLTSEKTVTRKLKEIIIALIVETKFEKEEILENYLNVIYMGQNGNFEVRGFSAAAKHYLNKPISHLNLSECALLAAILNNPGKYNPFKNPNNAIQRREKVLSHMLELKMIDASQLAKAKEDPLPQKESRNLHVPAPYYLDAVNKTLKNLKLMPQHEETGLKVYTYLQPDYQSLAQTQVRKSLENLDQRILKNNKQEFKNKSELQGLLIHVHIPSGRVLSLVGGRTFSKSQFNRAIESKRQVGSIFKPLVYLTALESQTKQGLPYSALTPIEDKKFTHKYEGQIWSPENYDKKYYGTVPLYLGLKNSLNAATAQLGIDIGLENIMELARRLGVKSELKSFPSLTLGAFEMSPIEVAQVYTNIANFGELKDLKLVKKVVAQNGQTLYENKSTSSFAVAPENVAKLIGIMKLAFVNGTAKSAQQMGFLSSAAGKTGTTSDLKDTWFVGFTPEHLVLTWVGYDDNTSTQLTGASGALPLWVEYVKQIVTENKDFTWPKSTQIKTLNVEDLEKQFPNLEKNEYQELELIF